MILQSLLHIHLHVHHLHGPAIDYVGVALAAAASWAGVPGPGEPVLIATGVIAARHKLDVSGVLIVAWLGATAGGIGGWIAGLRAGRALVTARGPLHKQRLNAVARGEQAFARHPVIAIVLTPSWVAGINRARARIYLIINAAAAALWAAGIGLGAYFAGPTVLDWVNDVGVVASVVVLVLVAAAVVTELMRRRRRRTPAPGRSPAEGPSP